MFTKPTLPLRKAFLLFASIAAVSALFYHYHNDESVEIKGSASVFTELSKGSPVPPFTFKKISDPSCIILENGVLTEVTGSCEKIKIKKVVKKVIHDPKIIHDDSLKYYSAQYDRVTPNRETLIEISQSYGLPNMTLFYQMMIEGRGKANVNKNQAGAKGYFQFLDATALEFGLIREGVDYRTNPYASADAAARYLLWIGHFLYGADVDLSDHNVLMHALAAYNAGHRRVSVNGKVRVPRFYETIRYTQNIIDLIEGNATLIMPNESLEDISARTGFSVSVLTESNFGVGSDRDLMAFEVIQLPENGVSKVIVKRGMSLSLIENKTGIKVDDIKDFNNLSSDIIRASDILMIPTSLYVKG